MRRCQHISLSQLCWRFLCFHSISSQNFSLIFSVPPGLECMKEQDLCNKIMATILENYNTLFEVEHTGSDNQSCENPTKLIIVKVSLIFSFSGLLYVEWKTFYLHHCFSWKFHLDITSGYYSYVYFILLMKPIFCMKCLLSNIYSSKIEE